MLKCFCGKNNISQGNVLDMAHFLESVSKASSHAEVSKEHSRSREDQQNKDNGHSITGAAKSLHATKG